MDLYKKKLFSDSLKDILLEDIYGNKGIVYHRTRIENLVDKVYDEGFKPGGGATYGKGFYSTYELESQLNPEMIEKYGNIIVKFMVNSINRFMFFDYDEFLKSPNSKKIKTSKDMFIIDQLKYFELNKFKKIDENEILKSQINAEYTSDIASYILSNYNVIIKLIDGIVFTGRQDGKVLVCYNTNLLIPLSFSDDEAKSWKKVNKNLDYLKKIFSQNINILKTKELKTYLKNYSKNVKKNVSSDAIYTININNSDIYINWEKGTWRDGIWYNGTWQRGTWEKGVWKTGEWNEGTWLDGTWEDGIWEDGTWKNGTWLSGEFDGNSSIWENGTWEDGFFYGTWKNGIWKNGTFINSATWENGTWEDGEFSGGTWLDGIWLKGSWYDGIWKGGTWENGIWERGIWYNGIWERGIWYKGIWEKGKWKYGNWFGGDWKNGTWENGQWQDGTWENGTWEKGDWFGGVWLGGYDKNGDFHPKDDSPDKWSK